MKEEKGLLLQEVEEKIASSRGFIVMRYENMAAACTREFRNSLVETSAEFEVAKRRILFKAFASAGFDLKIGDVKGHMGVVFAYEDLLPVAKQVLSFKKKYSDSLTFLAGRMDNTSLTGKEVESVAKLPSIQELRAQLVGVFAAPLSGVVGVMNSVLSGVISCVDQKVGKDS